MREYSKWTPARPADRASVLQGTVRLEHLDGGAGCDRFAVRSHLEGIRFCSQADSLPRPCMLGSWVSRLSDAPHQLRPYVEQRAPARPVYVELRTRCRLPPQDFPVSERDDCWRPFNARGVHASRVVG